MQEKTSLFLQNLIVYDYILFGAAFTFFLLFIIFAILLRRKLVLALLLILVSFSILALTPTVGYQYMHAYLFKNSLTLQSQQKLNFTQAVVVKATLSNDSKFDFKSCTITASAYKVSSNIYKNYLYPYKPFKNMSIVEEQIPRAAQREFKIIIEPFTYAGDYNISLQADCN
ncbi:MAG: DUF2393 domain-containing protein [Sulfurimonas sp.]|nr:DUF2393 domain-containing protein [Sulfurimonas sp.]